MQDIFKELGNIFAPEKLLKQVTYDDFDKLEKLTFQMGRNYELGKLIDLVYKENITIAEISNFISNELAEVGKKIDENGATNGNR